MTPEISPPIEPRRGCSYAFQTHGEARDVARQLAIFGADGVKIVQTELAWRVKFSSSWAIEEKLISAVPQSAGSFRTSSPVSKQERELIRELFCCWYDSFQLEGLLKRSKQGLKRILEAEGLLISYPDKGFVYDRNLLSDALVDCPSSGSGLPQPLVLVAANLGILDAAQYDLINDDEESGLPVSDLSPQQVEDIYSILYGTGLWEEGKNLALALGDRLNAARWLRRHSSDRTPIEFFQLLDGTKGLPMEILYQKELARAYWAWSLIHGYSKTVANWAKAAQARVIDYYACRSVVIPWTISHPDLRAANWITQALTVFSNEKALEALACDNNRLAAGILADMHRRRMIHSDYPLDAANRWAKIQEGYWPTEKDIHDALAAELSYDKQYAKKMEHLGLNEWGVPQRSYTAFW